MKRFIACLCLVGLLCCTVASAEIQKSAYLDAAFSALERDNIFVKKYNEITGSEVTLIFEPGIPYFFGAQDFQYLLKVKKVTQRSKYGRVNDKYIYGFDCVGYTRWIQTAVGDKLHPKLSQMILNYSKYPEYRMDELKKLTPSEIAARLEPGDFLVAKHSGRHILMFIGTLADYGFDAETAPELQDYLDYPLMISCVNDPNYYERTMAYIEENGLNALPSKGGVTISIVGMRESDAPHVKTENCAKEFCYYDLNGQYDLSVYDLPAATSYVWWRTVAADRGSAL